MNKNAQIPAKYLKILLSTVVEKLNHKIDPEWIAPDTYALLSLTDIHNRYVALDYVALLIATLIEKTGDHRISFEFGKQLDGNRNGIMGFAVHSARTFRESADIFIKYVNTVVPLVRCELEEFQSFFNFNWYLDIDEKLKPYAMEVLLAATTAGLEPTVPSHLFGFAIVNLGYSRPVYADLYEQYFPSEIRFDHPTNSISCISAVLDICNPNYDPILNSICLEQLEKIATNDKGVLVSVKQYIKSSLKFAPNIEEAADKMHMSSRTLKRRLSLHGVTFSDLLSRERLNAAVDYLQSSRLTIDEISHRLGYSNASSFINAFKRQYGISPAEWANRKVNKTA